MTTTTGERRDLVAALAKGRRFLRFTVQGLDDEQARRRTTVSALSLGGIVKHVSMVEELWARFIVEGAAAMVPADDAGLEAHRLSFELLDGETLQGVLERYEQVAAATDELVRSVPDLDATHALPDEPWFEPGASWSVRTVVLHIATETAQHAGHADIIRESLDGQKTMG